MTSYRGISDYRSNKMVISTSAMKELYGDLNFQQIRFHCRKHSVGRTFHVVTAANSSGNAVVQYFSGLTDVEPVSCGSYVRMEDDNSELARRCSEWSHGQSGKWSRAGKNWKNTGQRLYNLAAWIYGQYHWDLVDRNLFECDDMHTSPSSGDFWKVSFVKGNYHPLNDCFFLWSCIVTSSLLLEAFKSLQKLYSLLSSQKRGGHSMQVTRYSQHLTHGQSIIIGAITAFHSCVCPWGRTNM